MKEVVDTDSSFLHGEEVSHHILVDQADVANAVDLVDSVVEIGDEVDQAESFLD